jgi:hypothetical protein
MKALALGLLLTLPIAAAAAQQSPLFSDKVPNLGALGAPVAEGPGLRVDQGCKPGVDYCFTDWVCTDAQQNRRLALSHKLGTAPRFFNVFFAPSADSSRVFPLTWSWGAWENARNPVTIEVTTESMVLHIYSHSDKHLHGTWDAGSPDVWSRYSQGCFRAFMIR